MGDQTLPELVEDWYRIDAKAGAKKASLHVYDAIGGWFGLRVSDLVKEIDALDVDELDVFVNSPGGDAFGGLAIMNALRRHKATVAVHVDGLAASAASILAMGGDEVVMGRGAQLMIHDGSMFAWGPAAQMRKAAGILDKLSDSYAETYAMKAGGTAAMWRAAMVEESWYTAAEAVEAGLADRLIDDDDADEADVEAMWGPVLTIYQHAGRADAPAPTMPKIVGEPGPERPLSEATIRALAGSPVVMQSFTAEAVAASPEPGDETQEKGIPVGFVDEVRQRLGADTDADEAALLAALDDRMERPNVPEGAVLVEAEVLEGLQADAQAGREARDAQLLAQREAAVDKAQAEGRIAGPDARGRWLARLEKDFDAWAEALAEMPVRVNTVEKGITGGVAEASDVVSQAKAAVAAMQSKEESRG